MYDFRKLLLPSESHHGHGSFVEPPQIVQWIGVIFIFLKKKKCNYYLTVYTQTDVGIKQKGKNINARKQLFCEVRFWIQSFRDLQKFFNYSNARRIRLVRKLQNVKKNLSFFSNPSNPHFYILPLFQISKYAVLQI